MFVYFFPLVSQILGLDICADTLVGDAMKRGISGGQRKRLTTGEMITGPVKALFMDEITNGLDSATTFQIISCLKQLAHITDATLLISILQPAPETFELFDDIILMAEGKIVYHGPREYVLNFFEECGFRCPERKGVAEFLQEVISEKDQAQYSYKTELPSDYFSVYMFSRKFKESPLGKKVDEELSVPYDKSKSHKNALSFSAYSVSKWELFRAGMSRELLLMKRNSFVYIFKLSQVAILACITVTVFWHARNATDSRHAVFYMGAMFFALNLLLVDGYPEVPMTISRLPLFYKHRDLRFYPAWAYAVPASVLKLPFSFLESLVWTSITYYGIGYSPQFWRFFRQLILLFAVHAASSSMFRFLASVFQIQATALAACHLVLISALTFAGFVITRPSMPIWLKWGFWVSPLTYGEIGLSINEFLAPKWQKTLSANTTTTIGQQTLDSRGLNFGEEFYWISLAALIGFILIFDSGFSLVLTFFNYSKSSCAIVSLEKLSHIRNIDSGACVEVKSKDSLPSDDSKSNKGRMALPVEPLTLTFQDVQYAVDTPLEMREKGFAQRKLQLLSNITGAFRPGILTALMGVSGAGKTTLLDVLAGRKTSGYIEGEIKVGGYPKVQETFARISGYCEQFDIHSPLITVEESLIFSASLRLDSQIDSKTIKVRKTLFVNEVLETIELDGIKDALVGMPGVSGLSIEQRKRLTIAVELVANPSIIFLDEPTTGLDARAAAIVMRAVKNVTDTGRTIVCTIHQPSIEIFETFDELILLKRGGHIIYSGPLGQHSCRVIQYFEGVFGVPKITKNYNPATWMLEVTSPSTEAELGIDFAQIYKDSTLYEYNNELVRESSTPPPSSRDLNFPTRFPQNGWNQFRFCLWKQHLSYWRNPSYNLSRIVRVVVGSLVFGLLFWDKGNKINNQQDMLRILGSMFISVIFLGITNCSSVAPSVATERTVMYRERYSGMYSSLAFALAQVTIEIPYVFIQIVIFMAIAYPMIGFSRSVHKVLLFFIAMFFTQLYYLYLGMLLVALTPDIALSSIFTSAVYKLLSLFSGYMLPKQQIPKWWIWLFYLTPTAWTLNVLLTSQYGDVKKDIVAFWRNQKNSCLLGRLLWVSL
ncbi:hypothetical protein Patl1_07685 [Pistacia atlantica]|uniref:Uncharacterized protein n=1 Tax=Pistacia atlantica TaxID=434234 RepID=A0ACC1AFX8_9ROSI|nr:hypothetical protein Patl1_07685 [Pistacia atlantica]